MLSVSKGEVIILSEARLRLRPRTPEPAEVMMAVTMGYISLMYAMGYAFHKAAYDACTVMRDGRSIH